MAIFGDKIRDLARKAKDTADPVQAGVIYAQAAELAVELGKSRRAVALVSDAMKSLATAHAEPQLLSRAHLQVARAAEKAGLAPEALRSYGNAFALDPTLVAAAEAARAIATARADWPLVVQIFDRELAVTASEIDRAEKLRAQAAVVREHLRELDRAVAILERAVKEDPASVAAHRDLAAILVSRAERREDEDWAARDRYAAATALTDVADLLVDDEQIALVEEALDIAPEHLAALEKLEQAVPNDEERLLDRWARHVAAFPDSPVADDLRLRLGHALVERGQHEAALPYLEALARHDDLDSALLVIGIHARAGRAKEAAAWEAAQARASGEERLVVLRHVFQALNQLDADAAYASARAILREDPEDAVALDFCQTHLDRVERWDELEALLSELADAFDAGNKRRLSLLRKLAALEERTRGDLASALASWRAIESESEGRDARKARDERVRLAEAVGAWDELAELLDEMLNLARVGERVPLLLRLADVERDHRGNDEAAARAYIRILDAKEEIDEAHVLSSLAKVLGRVDRGSTVLAEAAAHADSASPERRAAIHRVLGRAYDQWAEHEKAFAAWTIVHEHDGRDEEAFERLVELAARTDRAPLAVALLESAVEGADPERAVLLHRRVATLATERTEEPDRAADALTAALELAPRDREIAELLSSALERASRHGERVVVLRLLASTAPDDETRLETKKRLAKLLSDTLHDEEEALVVWDQIAVGTRDVATLSELVTEAKEEGDARRLELLLRRLAAIEPKAGRRLDVLLERAQLLAKKLGRAREALESLVDATHGEARAHLPTLSYVESLATELGDAQALAHALDRQVDLAPPTVQPLVLARLVDLYEGTLDDPKRALETIARWERIKPDDPEPRLRAVPHLVAVRSYDDVLARLDHLTAVTPDQRAQLVESFVRTVESREPDHDEALAKLFLDLAKRAASPAQRKDLLIRGAAVCELTGAMGAAFDATAAAIAIAGPEDRLLGIVDRLAREAGRERELDAIYDRFTGGGALESRKVLVARHARLLEDGDRAGDAFERVLRVSQLAPGDEDLLALLEQLAPRAKRVPDLVAAYRERVALVGAGAPAVALLLRALVASYAHGRGFDALSLFAEAVEQARESSTLLERIEATALEAGQAALEQLMTVYQGASKREADPVRRAELLVRCARTMLTVAPDAKPAAVELLVEALELAPTIERLLDMIENVAAEHGLVEGVDAHLERTIDATMSDAVAATFLRRRGRLLHHRRGLPSEAADAYFRLWALRPSDPDVFRHIRVCLLETGRIHELISAAERELSNLTDAPQRVALLREIARLWEEEARNAWEARDAWKRVLDEAPGDTTATEALARLDAARKR